MESRFGRSFDQVRVHRDALAARSAHSVRARAYTVGQHVVFGRAQYAPHTGAGRRLLAHELVHTLQQRSVGAAALQRVAEWSTSSPQSPVEREADRVAERVVASAGPVARTDRPAVAAAGSIQRVAAGVIHRVSSAGCPPHPSGVGRTPASPDCPEMRTTVPGELFEYCVDSTQMKAPEVARLRAPAFLASLRAAQRVDVHGYASTDGPSEAYNMNLSCQRANDAKARLTALGIPTARMTTHKHGPTGGFATVDQNRSVVIAVQAPEQPTTTTRHARVAGVSFLSCAPCNPFSDDGLRGIAPPAAEPPAGFRQKHFIDITFQTTDNRTIVPGSVTATGGHVIGHSGYCGVTRPAAIAASTTGGATPVSRSGIDGIQVQSNMTSRVQALLPPTLPLSICGLTGASPRVPIIGNTFQARLLADGTVESEYHRATNFPFHYLYENGIIKMSGGSFVRPATNFASWAVSGAGSPPLAVLEIGFKALMQACSLGPVATGALCPTTCVGGVSTPSSVVGATQCGVWSAALAAMSCPTPLCTTTSTPTNRSPSGGI